MARPVRRQVKDGPQGRRPDAEEQRLVEALHRRDPDAIAAVEGRYGRILTGFLRDALPDSASAEDVRQQVLVEVWRRGPEYDSGRASLLTWVMTITRSRAIDERRRRRPAPLDPSLMSEAHEESREEFDELIERWRLAELLTRIPREEAVTLRLRFYEGLSQPEIAAQTGLALGTVKTRMVAGLARIRELIVEEGKS